MLDDREWFGFNGASDAAISHLGKNAPCTLPDSYIALLKFSNGGEGPLPIAPYNFVLDSAETTASTWSERLFQNDFPNLFVIGGNGGGEAIAIEMVHMKFGRVVCFDMTNINLDESVKLIAENFDSFVDLVGVA